jgi:hypothetical protein
MQGNLSDMKDFLISYTATDKEWAEILAGWLGEAGFTFILQLQDFVAGSNFVIEMHEAVKQCQRFLLVLSPEYLSAKYPEAEWTAAFAKDPTCAASTLIGVRVRECQPDGLLKPIVYIDLVGLSMQQARWKFLPEIMASIKGKRTIGTPPQAPASETKSASLSQTATGNNITQVAGNYFHYDSPPIKKVFVMPRPGAITAPLRTYWIGH